MDMPSKTNKAPKAILWFRNNLRIHDNPSLVKAIQESESLLCVYCHEPNETLEEWGFRRVGLHRQIFLRQALESLRAALILRGQLLVECLGAPEVVLSRQAKAVGTNLIFTEDIRAPYEIEEVRRLRESGLHVITTWQSSLIDPKDLPFEISRLPDIFTDFRHQIEGTGVRPRAPLPPPTKLPGPPNQFEQQSPSIEGCTHLLDPNSSFPYDQALFFGGEDAALFHLAKYLEHRLPDTYKQTRNELSGVEFSSKFSPWLAQGALSPRKAYEALKCYESQFGSNEGTYWLWFELLWRDYFRFLHVKYGRRLYLASGLRGLNRVQYNEEAFKSWCLGQTGHRLIDAGMNELSLTGYLSNRMRQIVASFLVNDLQCDWRAGAAWFESQLIDYDVYSNQGNWLYIAGYGTDPRGGRHFNPDKQAKTYDPSGEYRSYWLKEGVYPE